MIFGLRKKNDTIFRPSSRESNLGMSYPCIEHWRPSLPFLTSSQYRYDLIVVRRSATKSTVYQISSGPTKANPRAAYTLRRSIQAAPSGGDDPMVKLHTVSEEEYNDFLGQRDKKTWTQKLVEKVKILLGRFEGRFGDDVLADLAEKGGLDV